MNNEQQTAFDNLFPKRRSKVLRIILITVGIIVGCFIVLMAYFYYADQREQAELEQTYNINVRDSQVAILKLNDDVHHWLNLTMKEKDKISPEETDEYTVRLANLRNIRTFDGKWDTVGTLITEGCYMQPERGCGWSNFTYKLNKPLGGVSEVLISHTNAVSEQAVKVILDHGISNAMPFINISLLDESRYWGGKSWDKPVYLPQF